MAQLNLYNFWMKIHNRDLLRSNHLGNVLANYLACKLLGVTFLINVKNTWNWKTQI